MLSISALSVQVAHSDVEMPGLPLVRVQQTFLQNSKMSRLAGKSTSFC